jgi:hypothetical protein
MKRLVPALVLFASACGANGATAVPTTNPPTPATTTAPCILEESGATLGFKEPGVPHEAAGVVVVDCKEHVCTVEARDRDGKVASHEASVHDASSAVSTAVVHGACAIGGETFFVAAEPKDDAHVEVQVARYTAHDEARDLARICAPLASFEDKGKPIDDSSFDDSQRAHVRAAILVNELTSRRWRVWFHRLYEGGQRHEDQVEALRKAVKDASIASCKAEWLIAK